MSMSLLRIVILSSAISFISSLKHGSAQKQVSLAESDSHKQMLETSTMRVTLTRIQHKLPKIVANLA